MCWSYGKFGIDDIADVLEVATFVEEFRGEALDDYRRDGGAFGATRAIERRRWFCMRCFVVVKIVNVHV